MTGKLAVLLMTVLLVVGCDAKEDAVAPKASKSGQDVETAHSAIAMPPPVKTAPTPGTSSGASACQTQDGHAIAANRLKAVGTEPFWGATVDGRCVTYSHPDNPSGTRVWTRFSGSAANGTWSGALNGEAFVMRTQSSSNCSDGMSDETYPIAVELSVGATRLSGCAKPR